MNASYLDDDGLIDDHPQQQQVERLLALVELPLLLALLARSYWRWSTPAHSR
jgi:hypothetical protein